MLARPKAKIRPSSQKLKGALFSILGDGINEASFLELYAGSGAVGIEALSRGADRVYFVEENRSCLKTITDNLKRLNIPYTYGPVYSLPRPEKGPTVRIFPAKAEQALRRLAQTGAGFDFIFLDPPYAQNSLKNCLIKVSQYDILNPRCLVIAEHNQRAGLGNSIGGLSLRLERH